MRKVHFFFGFVICLALSPAVGVAGGDGTEPQLPEVQVHADFLEINHDVAERAGEMREQLAEEQGAPLPSDYPPSAETPSQQSAPPPVSLDQCHQAFSEANECCNNPLACMGVGASAQDIAGAVTLIGTMASMSMGSMSADQRASMQQACQIMQMVGAAAGAVNGGGAAICHQKKNSCLSACGEVKDSINGHRRAMSEYCGQLSETLRAQVAECNQGSSTEEESNLTIANSRIQQCETFSANVQAMGQQAVQSGTAASMGQLCASLAGSGSETPTSVTDLTDIDCSDPANQADLRCRDCSDPKNAENPLCINTDLGDGGDSGSLGSSAGLGGSPSSFDVGNQGDGDASKQTPKFGEFGSQSASAKTIPSNGGGVPIAGNTGGGLGGGGSGGQGGGGYNTDVLRGLGGGSGYSGNPGGGYVSSSGGFSGYGGRPTRSPRRGFDLKQFLPGGKRDPNRKIAGGRIHSDIGPSHVDIWGRLSNRVKEICKLNRLYDCGR